MNGNAAIGSNLFTLVIVAFVVVRFLMRELRARVIRLRTLWIRPLILVVLTAFFAYEAFARPFADAGLTALSLIGGAAAGAIVGALVVRSTAFEAAGEPHAVRARGSWLTVAIWLVALALRFAARFALSPSDPRTPAGIAQFFALNTGLLALVTAAFAVVALGFYRAIDRYGAQAAGAPPTSRSL